MAWNWKFNNQIFRLYNSYSRGTVIDGMLAKYILNEERPHGLKDMVARYLPEFKDYEKKDNFDKIPWDKKPLEQLCEYGCLDTDLTLRLSLFFEDRLIKNGYYALYRNLIIPASNVLQEAEQNGLYFDKDFNDFLIEKYHGLISDNEQAIRKVKVVRSVIKVI